MYNVRLISTPYSGNVTKDIELIDEAISESRSAELANDKFSIWKVQDILVTAKEILGADQDLNYRDNIDLIDLNELEIDSETEARFKTLEELDEYLKEKSNIQLEFSDSVTDAKVRFFKALK